MSHQRTIVLEVQAPLRPEDVRRLRAGLSQADVVCHVSGGLDVGSLDALTHLHLEARRAHRSLALRVDDPGLLALTGFATAVPGLEVGGETEAGEEALGVEEVVDVGDPPV